MLNTDVSGFVWYNGNLPWLATNTVMLTRTGSHAYGTNLPSSDEDFKGIAIPPKKYFLGYLNKFEQAEHKKPDITIYDIRKFFNLAMDNNPSIIEMLYTKDYIVPEPLATSIFRDIWEVRDKFLSKRAVYSFSGYAIAQLKRINTHRSYLLNPPKKHPERSDYGLPNSPTLEKEQFGVIEAKIRKMEDELGGRGLTKDKVEGADEELVTMAISSIDLPKNLIPLVLNERRYNSAMRYWKQYQNWKTERNKDRSELEAKYGYDTKHGMHLVRLLRMGLEIVKEGKVIVKRPDAEELLSIRRGAWSFDKLIEWAKTTETELNNCAENSKLPKEPDRVFLDTILVNIVEEFLYKRREVE